MSEFSINLAIVLAALLMAFAISAWIYIRNRQTGVKVMKVEFGQAQLRFARKQFETQIHHREQMLGNLNNMRVGPGGGPHTH